MTERWNWTPNQIEALDSNDRLMYSFMLSGVVTGESPPVKTKK